MTEHEIEELSRTVREHYNPPPATPREAIWARVQEGMAQAEQGATPQVDAAPVDARRGPAQGLRWWPAAAAAGLILAVGFGLGRGSVDAPPAGTETVAVESEAPAATPEATPASSNTEGRRQGPFRLAAVRHLAETGTLLARVGASQGDGRISPDLGSMAERLLTDTRLMLDGRDDLDPELRSLLEDLELVLIQVVHAGRAGERNDPNRERLEVQELTQGLEDAEVLPRIRRLLPAVSGA